MSAQRFPHLEAPPRGTARPLGTLVLIHAFPLNARMWEPQLALADQGWRIVAPHLRGVDGGDQNRPVASLADYAGDIVDLLDALHVHEAVIGGLSLGGYVAFELFRRVPGAFRGLVLADTRPQADTPEAIEARTQMLALVAAQGADALADQMLPRLLGQETLRTRPDVVRRVRDQITATPPEAISGAIRAMIGRPDSTPTLKTIHCPTLIVVGEEDTVTPPAVSRDMLGAIGGAELTVVPKAGHLSNLEQPEAFNGALARFLAHRV